jgi:hypothetical protein
MTESETVARGKYATVNIPVKLFVRIERLVDRNNDFKTVTDYVTFVLREVVMAHSNDPKSCFDSKDLEQLKYRLEALEAL